MSDPNWLTPALALLAAHLLGDFVFQSREDVRNKRRFRVLAKHCLIHAGLSALLLGRWELYWLPLIVFFGHGLTDWIKTRSRGTGWVAFVLDQFAHGVLLAGLTVAVVAVTPAGVPLTAWEGVPGGTIYPAVLVVLAGWTLTVRAGAFFIAAVVAPYQQQLEQEIERISRIRSRAAGPDGLARPRQGIPGAGSTIGQLERFLIFVFVLTGGIPAIGFLVAAKSVFRFGELKDAENRMESEYILIGTLLSFAYALVTSLGSLWVLNRIGS